MATKLGLFNSPPKTSILALEQLNGSTAKDIYTPLQKNETRLVKLHKGRWSPIYCTMCNINLNIALEYEALSYVWGSQKHPETIFLNERKFKITHSLYAALGYLRSPTEDRMLWIDALSINQSHIPERNDQVRQMRTIYSMASNVILWLGSNIPDIDRMFEQINHLNEPPTQITVRYQGEIVTSLEDPVMKYLLEMEGLPYWKRVWTVQEVMFAKMVSIQFGAMSLPYSKFIKHYNESCDNLKDWAPGMLDYSPMKMLMTMVKSFGPRAFPLPSQALNGNQITAKDWLKAGSYNRLCNDPRDRVFGLWGCFSQDIRNSILVDYSKDYETVYTQFFRTLIENTRSLDPLLDSCAESWERAKDLDNWKGPSWVRRFNLVDVGVDHHYEGRSAFGSLPTYFRFSGQNQFLHAKGILIGTVVQCTKVYTSNTQWIHSKVFELSRHMQEAYKTLNVPKGSSNLFINACAGLSENFEVRFFVLEALFKQFKEAEDLVMRDQAEVLSFLSDVHLGQHIFSFSHCSCQTQQIGKVLQPVRDDYGIGTNGIQQNDLLVILLGCSVPLVLRPRGGHKILVGKAMIPGYMDGEGVRGIKVREDIDGNNTFVGAEDFVLC